MKTSTVLLAAAALGVAAAQADTGHDLAHGGVHGDSPLVTKVHNANKQFEDVNVAIGQGFKRGTPCVSGPDFGAMGVHYIMQDRVANAVLQAETPQALIYEPQYDGSLRLVGVEFILLASVWQSQHGGASAPPPALDGNLLNFVNEPNRYGLPAFYELHVWAFEHNPVGSFADWNTQVFCDKQPDRN
jgi:hypothetical protein